MQLGAALLWFAVTGFPIKLSKADSGSTVTWIGASIQTDDELQATRVTIPEEKIKELLNTCKRFLAKPVVGRKELRSFAGALSFVAGVVLAYGQWLRKRMTGVKPPESLCTLAASAKR